MADISVSLFSKSLNRREQKVDRMGTARVYSGLWQLHYGFPVVIRLLLFLTKYRRLSVIGAQTNNPCWAYRNEVYQLFFSLPA